MRVYQFAQLALLVSFHESGVIMANLEKLTFYLILTRTIRAEFVENSIESSVRLEIIYASQNNNS